MTMSSPVDLTLFDFVDDFAREVEAGELRPAQSIAGSASIIVFCESFFDQVFARALDLTIKGFNTESKREAARLLEEPVNRKGLSAECRRLIALFETFCDMYADVIKGSYGAGVITYQRFHKKYMLRLLNGAKAWAAREGHEDLLARIDTACVVYNNAIRAMKW